MADIRWLPQAREDLQRLHAFIAPHSHVAAGKAIDVILEAAEQLSAHPEIGRLWQPDTNYREWPVRFGAKNYVLRYRIFENQIIIARVWHGLETR